MEEAEKGRRVRRAELNHLAICVFESQRLLPCVLEIKVRMMSAVPKERKSHQVDL